jgi:hypothetical protein
MFEEAIFNLEEKYQIMLGLRVENDFFFRCCSSIELQVCGGPMFVCCMQVVDISWVL